jgi:predicted ATPase
MQVDQIEPIAQNQKPYISNISIKGWKSIRELTDFSLNRLNVLIGANGAGKSNLLSFFTLLTYMADERLQEYVLQQGGANKLLYQGTKKTPQMEAELTLNTVAGDNEYRFRLFHISGDSLSFAEEEYRYTRKGTSERPFNPLGNSHKETQLRQYAEKESSAKFLHGAIKRCYTYQFHDTTPESPMKQRSGRGNAQFLRGNAGNIAPFLFSLKENHTAHYDNIVNTLRQVLPFFHDFYFDTQYPTLLLSWTEKGDREYLFTADQASDGMLRVIALVTLLLQPPQNLPNLILLDEPELGLHPSAISIVSGLIQSAALETQIIVSTQSPYFVDCFEPEDIIVVERDKYLKGERVKGTHFARLNAEELEDWFAEYTLAELWEKNILGGKP